MADHAGRRRSWTIGTLVTLLSVTIAAGCTSRPEQRAASVTTAQTGSTTMIDRSEPPFVRGTRLEVLDDTSRPPEPSQWGEGEAPVPFGQWWSGLAAGPGIPALWAQPLLLRMDDGGRADLSAPTRTTRTDGFRDAHVEPAAFFEFGTDATVSVIDHGPLHVKFSLSNDQANVTITMVQGSPFLEFEGNGTLGLTVPSLSGLASTVDGPTVERFSTASGPWLLASSGASQRDVDGDVVVFHLTPGIRYAIGPVADDAGDSYDAAALFAAAAPLETTAERLTVEPDGSVRQVLQQHRTQAGPTAWSLLPHHEEHLSGETESIGSLASVHGQSSIVTATELTLEFPAVPILWDTVIPPGFDPSDVSLGDVPAMATGSYFGAKHTATAAMVHDVLSAAGADAEAAPYFEAAAASLDSLMTSSAEPRLTWDPGWGSVVVMPAEFGSGLELNDHQLQNGYWVGAAASVLAADPTRRSLIEDGIDLLIADYAGAGTVPYLAGSVSSEGTWSPFDGHSWASGIGGFAAGNNLESISESSYAWWAAAKWFLVTDRAALAEPFIARLTIESWLTGNEWLPTPDNLPDDPATRPWSGVVWAGKTDPGTWFDASDEAALGIRLLPIGPQSFSRYHSSAAVAAAGVRWTWCEERGEGCVERWWNLLDTDAAVAGRAELSAGDLPEESTTDVVRQWWRASWEGATLAEGWSCTPGTVIRVTTDGSLVALVTNPSPHDVAVTCDHDGRSSFETTAEARSSAFLPIE